MMYTSSLHKRVGAIIVVVLLLTTSIFTHADIAATHIYHNHMPNFWPYYNVDQYPGAAVGSPIRYTYDGQVINLKNSPPSEYTFYISGSDAPMPHDDITSYYSHHAKVGAYQYWPMDTAKNNHDAHPLSQTHVTMSASVINNVQSFTELGNLSGYHPGWGNYWLDTQQSVKTTNGYNALDTIHFSGHHTMGPLVGNNYFLKDLIYQNVTLAQDYFLGDQFKSSRGFFPTELGFSERIIPALTKLGIEWSVLGNVHYSRTLKDYPYLNDPGVDTLVSPPNRADLQNTSDVGDWVALQMFNEKQVTQNKFPFASIPHWVQYIDPETAEAHRVAGIPVEQASSWEEGYQGSVKADALKPFEGVASALGRTQYFVIAHDGDNSSGRAGDGGTWANSGYTTYADSGVTGKGVDEYLRAHPIPPEDIVHVQDGSWIDTRDSSADPTWYHWHLPMGVWSGQLSAFNAAHNTDYPLMYSASGQLRSHMPSLEYGYHYLERNFALLQAAENYAQTAEQIWLDDHPNHWSPTTALDHEVTYPGNQLNPWMLSYPVKGDAANDYTDGANPAELAWYFLIAAIDSGFGYYDENVDDNVKPTLSFNQSLYFSEPYVHTNLGKDRTGPSLWWPQRYPHNPGSVNNSKAEGWATLYTDNVFAIYTYAYDVSEISDIQVKIRVHKNPSADPKDKTYQLYDPAAHANDPNVTPSNVGDWINYSMNMRDLEPDINGVVWQPAGKSTFDVVPAQKIGNLYYTYFDNYRNQLLDYYIEATDANGNITKSDIQQVFVGAGRYTMAGGKKVEDINGAIEGEHAFFTDQAIRRNVMVYLQTKNANESTLSTQTKEDGETHWTNTPSSPVNGSDRYFSLRGSYSDDTSGLWVSFFDDSNWVPSNNGVKLSEGTYTIYADGSVSSGAPKDLNFQTTLYYSASLWPQACMHYRIDGGAWTSAPGIVMANNPDNWYSTRIDMGAGSEVEFALNDCNARWDSDGGRNYTIGAGVWNLKDGVIAEGAPDGSGNAAPTAVITPDNTTVLKGTAVELSGASSTDDKGIASYLWSTGATSQNTTVVVEHTQSVSLTVTDEEGLSHTSNVTLTVGSQFTSEFNTLYFRGTPNAWGLTEMQLVADNSWKVTVIFDGQAQQRYKFDVNGDWTINYGDDNADGSLNVSGDDIFSSVIGSCDIFVNDLTLRTTTICDRELTPPVAVIDPATVEIAIDQSITLSGAGSYDTDGSIVQYRWSNGNSSPEQSLSYAAEGTYTLSLTVADDDGLTHTTQSTINVVDRCREFAHNFDSLYFRGTTNNWQAMEMHLVADNIWQTTVNFDGQSDQRYKFDVMGDWLLNFGDSHNDGQLEQHGGDIFTPVSGTYVVELNDKTMRYSLLPDRQYCAHPTMNIRGTFNNWNIQPMQCVDRIWTATATFSGDADARFKFDASSDWTSNWGDDNGDGVVEQSGGDIHVHNAGEHTVRFDDHSGVYWIE